MKEIVTITVRREGDARGAREFTANLTGAQLKDDNGKLLQAALNACRSALDKLDSKPDWDKIKAIAREAQSHIDSKTQIKSLGHSLRWRIHDARTRAQAFGYRGSEEEWMEFMRRHG